MLKVLILLVDGLKEFDDVYEAGFDRDKGVFMVRQWDKLGRAIVGVKKQDFLIEDVIKFSVHQSKK